MTPNGSGSAQVVPAPAHLASKLIGHRQLTRETTAIRGDPSRDPTEPPPGLWVVPLNAADASAANGFDRAGRRRVRGPAG